MYYTWWALTGAYFKTLGGGGTDQDTLNKAQTREGFLNSFLFYFVLHDSFVFNIKDVCFVNMNKDLNANDC